METTIHDLQRTQNNTAGLLLAANSRSDANCQAVPSPSALVASVTPGHIKEDVKGSYNWCCILVQRALCFNTSLLSAHNLLPYQRFHWILILLCCSCHMEQLTCSDIILCDCEYLGISLRDYGRVSV